MIHRAFFVCAAVFLCALGAEAAYPHVDTFGTPGAMAGLSSVHDPVAQVHHCAYIDLAAGRVVYKAVSTTGALHSSTVVEQVSTTQETLEVWAKTSIAIDSSSRPVIAYTKQDGTSVRSVRVARWSGVDWIDTEVAGGGVYSTLLSLALHQGNAAAWRLAYVNFAGPRLMLASAAVPAGSKVVDLPSSPWSAGVSLRYSATGGHLAYRDLLAGSLKFASLTDDGTGLPTITDISTVDSSTDAGSGIRIQQAPDGRHHLVYSSGDGRAIIRATRGNDATWSRETAIQSPNTLLANPVLAFDVYGHPMIACTDGVGSRLRFAAQIGGRWFEDDIDTADFYSHPVFLSPQPGGGHRLFAVGQASNSAAMHLRAFGVIDDFVDSDHDGVPLRFERAFMMNPLVADSGKLPKISERVIGGQRKLVLTMQQVPGGTPTGGVSYQTVDHVITVQASRDLVNWVSSSDVIQHVDSFTFSGIRYAESCLADPIGMASGYRFMRVDVSRR